MAHPELPQNPYDHDLYPKYPEGVLPPPQVARATTFMLNYYFYSGLEDVSEIRTSLQDVTLPFVDTVNAGIVHNVNKIDRLSLLSDHDAQEVLQRIYKTDNPHEEIALEAFSYSSNIFAMMPEIARQLGYGGTFSRRGLLEPPSTVREYLDRVDEIRDTIDGIVQGEIQSVTNISLDDKVKKTYLYFWTGNQLPYVIKQQPRIVEAHTRKMFDSLLSDIEGIDTLD